MAVQHLVLFEDVTKGTALFKQMTQAGIDCKVSFSPPDLEKVCGIAVEYFDLEEQEKIKDLAEKKGIEIKAFYEYEKE